ncbi:mavicyanin isoform X2 [Gossypium hirsutum]|uniref:Mavicyanin isoform X2 n=1 Tax=Gossypium hirsutum TaxID=3635 RepID=A0ABM3BRD8_GOSHI|nr:mavicyanin-like isoform X2 [Gossypium hirsutum]
MAIVKMVMAVVIMAASLGGKLGAAQVHHVVGGDRGWDVSSDVASWSSGRSFRVGDKISQESIAEVNSPEEYESCDVSNPIRMYTDGIDGIPLDGEGIRYFVSGKEESCKNGLKLHVEVMPFGNPEPERPRVAVAAAAPTTPSGSARLYGSSVLLLAGLWLCYMAI